MREMSDYDVKSRLIKDEGNNHPAMFLTNSDTFFDASVVNSFAFMFKNLTAHNIIHSLLYFGKSSSRLKMQKGRRKKRFLSESCCKE